jgi:hypothetical protein
MNLQEQLVAYAAARNRRFIVAAAIVLATMLAQALIQRGIEPGAVPKAVWVGATAVIGLSFAIYVMWDFHLRPLALGHRCPNCKQRLVGYMERAAIDTGRCTNCQANIAQASGLTR